ncbi:Peroxisomal membrane protein PAS20 [Chytriomyces hyalinus]|nr:Peroxisomal membrane protein PAS20 [Chytriomyces hyalinus]
MVSPPKPWESGAGAAPPLPQQGPSSSSAAPPPLPSSNPADEFSGFNSDLGPSIPNRPTSLDVTGVNRGYGGSMGLGGMAQGYGGMGGYGGGMYGSSMYDQGGYGGGYGAGGYNRFNRFGSGGYGMGGSYGGYGGVGGYGGYGGAVGGMYGRPAGFNPNNPNEIPLTAQIEQSTQHAFQSIDQIVQAFTGFSQMLESTFFATHSSFMAMVGVAEQLGYLRNYLGGVVSALTFSDYIKKWIYFAMGKPMPVDPKSITAEGFDKFNGTGPNGAKKPSQKPVWLFLLFMFGFPWLMSKLIQRLQKKQLEDAAAAAGGGGLQPLLIGPDGTPLQASQIKELEFCKALYDFNANSPAELSFRKGDVIAILSKVDPVTREASQWWRGRLRTGQMGHFPSNYVEAIVKRDTPAVNGTAALTNGNGKAATSPVPSNTQNENGQQPAIAPGSFAADTTFTKG